MPSRAHLFLGAGAVALMLLAAAAKPQPAGACSCAFSVADLALADVELVTPVRDLDEDEMAQMEREETLLWPQEAWVDALGSFGGSGGLELRLEEVQ